MALTKVKGSVINASGISHTYQDSSIVDVGAELDALDNGTVNIGNNTASKGSATNTLIKNSTIDSATRLHIEPSGIIKTGTSTKQDWMFDPYEDDSSTYRIVNVYTKNGAVDGNNGEDGVAVLGVKSSGSDHWGVWPTLHIGFQDDATGAVPLKIHYFDTSDSVWRTPMLGIWQTNLAVVIGDHVITGYKIYRATTAGTTGATKPTHTTGTVSDGIVDWLFIRDFQPQASNLKPCVTIGDRDDMPVFGYPDVRLQLSKDTLLHWGAEILFLASDNVTLGANIALSESSGITFLNLKVEKGAGNESIRIGDAGYYQAINLCKSYVPKAPADLSTIVDVSRTEFIRFNYTADTTIADFSNGTPYQLIKIASVGVGIVTIANNANINTGTGVDIILSSTTIVQFLGDYNGSVFQQIV